MYGQESGGKMFGSSLLEGKAEATILLQVNKS